MCIATVDLPDPPFSLATTMMRADGGQLPVSTDMTSSNVGVRSSVANHRMIDSDSYRHRKRLIM
jgi:hypothetical protein